MFSVGTAMSYGGGVSMDVRRRSRGDPLTSGGLEKERKITVDPTDGGAWHSPLQPPRRAVLPCRALWTGRGIARSTVAVSVTCRPPW